MDCLGLHFAAATELARIAMSLIHLLDAYGAVRPDNTGSLPESCRADGVAHLHQMQCESPGATNYHGWWPRRCSCGRGSLILNMTALRAVTKGHLVCSAQLIGTRTQYDSGTRDLWWNLAIRTTLF